eukprot:1751358-Pyramimonas_sp.AAC.1
MDAFDTIPVSPSSELDIYIDDSGVSAYGPKSVVVLSIVRASTALHAAIALMLGCSLALDK